MNYLSVYIAHLYNFKIVKHALFAVPFFELFDTTDRLYASSASWMWPLLVHNRSAEWGMRNLSRAGTAMPKSSMPTHNALQVGLSCSSAFQPPVVRSVLILLYPHLLSITMAIDCFNFYAGWWPCLTGPHSLCWLWWSSHSHAMTLQSWSIVVNRTLSRSQADVPL